jgi:WD40 repeat protein
MHQLDNIKLLSRLKALGKKENVVTAAVYNAAYDYLAIGYQSGLLRVWKVDGNSKQSVYAFEGHGRQILSLQNHERDSALLMSVANDLTMRVWNIDTFHFVILFRL